MPKITVNDSVDMDDGARLTTVVGACAAGCLLLGAVSLANLATTGLLFWALVLVALAIVIGGLFWLNSLKSGTLPAGDVEEGDGEESGGTDDGPGPPVDSDGTSPGQVVRSGSAAPIKVVADIEELERKIEALREKLKTSNRRDDPLAFGAAMHEMGDALYDQGVALLDTEMPGDALRGVTNLKNASKAYYRALRDRTLGVAPLEYTVTQSRLGRTLFAVARRETNPQFLAEAIAALSEALRLLDPECEEALSARELVETAQRLQEIRIEAK